MPVEMMQAVSTVGRYFLPPFCDLDLLETQMRH